MRTGGNKKGLTGLLSVRTIPSGLGYKKGPTAIDIRHIEHSDEWVEAASFSFWGVALPKLRRRLCVVTLWSVSA